MWNTHYSYYTISWNYTKTGEREQLAFWERTSIQQFSSGRLRLLNNTPRTTSAEFVGSWSCRVVLVLSSTPPSIMWSRTTPE